MYHKMYDKKKYDDNEICHEMCGGMYNESTVEM